MVGDGLQRPPPGLAVGRCGLRDRHRTDVASPPADINPARGVSFARHPPTATSSARARCANIRQDLSSSAFVYKPPPAFPWQPAACFPSPAGLLSPMIAAPPLASALFSVGDEPPFALAPVPPSPALAGKAGWRRCSHDHDPAGLWLWPVAVALRWRWPPNRPRFPILQTDCWPKSRSRQRLKPAVQQAAGMEAVMLTGAWRAATAQPLGCSCWWPAGRLGLTCWSLWWFLGAKQTGRRFGGAPGEMGSSRSHHTSDGGLRAKARSRVAGGTAVRLCLPPPRAQQLQWPRVLFPTFSAFLDLPRRDHHGCLELAAGEAGALPLPLRHELRARRSLKVVGARDAPPGE